METQDWLIVIAIIFGSLVIYSLYARKRKQKIETKYSDDPELAAKIVARQIWEGQTTEQLVDSIGRPSKIDEQNLKTKTKHIYKYSPDKQGRYRLKVTLENGRVSGWEKRG